MSSHRKDTRATPTGKHLRPRKSGSPEKKDEKRDSTPPQPLGDLVRCSVCNERFYGQVYLNCHIRNEHGHETKTITKEQVSRITKPIQTIADNS